MDAVSGALIDAGRLFSTIKAVIAKMAFFRHPFLGVELHHSKRTGLEASLTTIAGLGINKDDTVRPLTDSCNRASLFTRGGGALEAAGGIKGQS